MSSRIILVFEKLGFKEIITLTLSNRPTLTLRYLLGRLSCIVTAISIILCLFISVLQASHDLSLSDGEVVSHMVKAGVGLLVAFQNKALLRIFHLETFQHLQDVNVASAVQKLLEGRSINVLCHNHQ